MRNYNRLTTRSAKPFSPNTTFRSAEAAIFSSTSSSEPVQACPPSAGYRLRKCARRNKAALIAASVVAAALFLGLIGTARQAIRRHPCRARGRRRPRSTRRNR